MAWLMGSWLHLYGWKLWVFRFALWFLGFVAVGLVFWFMKRTRKAEEAEPGDEELDSTIASARSRLAASPAAGSATLSNLPMVLFVGPEGSTKTSVIVHSGLDPDLLAGSVFQADKVAPTSCVNLWYTHNTIFTEAGGAFASDPSRFNRLIRFIRPRTFSAAFSGGPQAPRVAVVCFSCEELLKPDAASGVPAAARELREILVDLAHGFGTQLPVYVLFTKADRIPFFAEFVRNFSREEAQQVLGSTLRWPTTVAAAQSADREFQRVNDAFHRIFDSLAEKRLVLLPRETDGGRKGGVYEFPREFRKISTLAAQFLVDMCRPSQLRVSPVLRGFYFSGVRAVIVSDAASVDTPQVTPTPDPGHLAATQVFDHRRHKAVADPATPHTSGSRKIPQWVFLGRFFRDVLLRDRMAMGVTKSSARLVLWRRVLVASGAAFCLLLSTCFTVSYVGNRRLEGRALSAATQLSRTSILEPDYLDPVALHGLEDIRDEDELLADYERGRPRLRLRWGLYKGSALYPLIHDLYFERFESLMLEPARNLLLDSLRSLPDVPEATSEYGPNYDLLKAYLMTTGSCELDSAFLSPKLHDLWLDRDVQDAELNDLAIRQFDFYAGKLCRDRPCERAYDRGAVRRARAFLNQFSGADRNYNMIVASASRSVEGIRFSDPSGAVVNRYEVPGAFTVSGWAVMEDNLEHVDEILQGEECVMGEGLVSGRDLLGLEDSLRARYVSDYVQRWREFTERRSVSSAGDAPHGRSQHGGGLGAGSSCLSAGSHAHAAGRDGPAHRG
jgi:type VI secretion system protein ImpL